MMYYVKNILMVLFVLMGVSFLIPTLHGLFQLTTASDWRNTTGKILTVEVSSALAGKPPNRAPVSQRSLSYSYMVDGNSFTGSKEYFGVAVATNKETSGGYWKGKNVTVYYDPDSPENSVLDPKSYRGIGLPLMASAVFLIFGGFGIYKLRKDRLRDRSALNSPVSDAGYNKIGEREK